MGILHGYCITVCLSALHQNLYVVVSIKLIKHFFNLQYFICVFVCILFNILEVMNIHASVCVPVGVGWGCACNGGKQNKLLIILFKKSRSENLLTQKLPKKSIVLKTYVN